MATPRHIDFEPPQWGEFLQPPQDWPTYAQRILALGPLAYWRLGDADGQPAIDSAGHLGPGTFSGSTQHQQPGALAHDSDGSVTLDGVSGAIEFPNNDLFNGATQGSLLFWMKYQAPEVVADGGVIARWANTGSGNHFGWMIWVDRSAAIGGSERTVTFAANAGAGVGGRIEGPTDLVVPGVWDAYAATFRGADALRLYKNGQLIGEQPTGLASFITTNQPLRLGRTGGSIGHLSASLDEVAVFDIALEPEAIATLYDAGVGHLRLPTMEGAI